MKDEFEDIIYDFGKEVIVPAREKTIQDSLGIFCKTAKDSLNNELVKRSEQLNFSDEQKEFLKIFLLDAIDSSLNNFIWMMEQYNDDFSFNAKTVDGISFDLEKESDGLCMGQFVFIDEYSRYNTAEDFFQTGELEKVPNCK